MPLRRDPVQEEPLMPTLRAADFPGGSGVKNPLAKARDAGEEGPIPGSGRSPGGGNGNLGKPMDREAWGGLQSGGSAESNTTERLSTHSGCAELAGAMKTALLTFPALIEQYPEEFKAGPPLPASSKSVGTVRGSEGIPRSSAAWPSEAGFPSSADGR